MTPEHIDVSDPKKGEKEIVLYPLQMKTIVMIMVAFIFLGIIVGFGIVENINRYHANKSPTQKVQQCR